MASNVYDDCCDFCERGESDKKICETYINRCAPLGLTNDIPCMGHCQKCRDFKRAEFLDGIDGKRFAAAMRRDFAIPSGGLEARLAKRGRPASLELTRRCSSMMTSSDRERLLEIIGTKATMDEPISAFTIAWELGKNGPDGQTEINTHIRDLLNDNLIVQKPRRGWPCYYLKSQQVKAEEIKVDVPKPDEYVEAEDDEADEDLSGDDEPITKKVIEPAKIQTERQDDIQTEEEESADEFKAPCGKVLPSQKGRNIHTGLCKKCKALMLAPVKAAKEQSHFKECEHCGKKLSPQGVWKHEASCEKNPAAIKLRTVAEQEVKGYLQGETHTWMPKDGGALASASVPFPEQRPVVSSPPLKRYKLNTHVNDIVVDESELATEIKWLMAHGVKEITIKEVSP